MKTPRLREWREAFGTTQSELSGAAGVSEHTISRIEHGAELRPNTARRLAEALGVTVADLIEKPPTLLPRMEVSPPGKAEAPDTNTFLQTGRMEFLGLIEDMNREELSRLAALLNDEYARVIKEWEASKESPRFTEVSSRLADVSAKALMANMQIRVLENPSSSFVEAGRIRELAGA